MDENTARFGAKKFAIGVNTGRKQEREHQEGARRKSFKAGRKAGQNQERQRQAAEQRRKKWYRKVVFASVGLSIVVLKGLPLVASYLLR